MNYGELTIVIILIIVGVCLMADFVNEFDGKKFGIGLMIVVLGIAGALYIHNGYAKKELVRKEKFEKYVVQEVEKETNEESAEIVLDKKASEGYYLVKTDNLVYKVYVKDKKVSLIVEDGVLLKDESN